MTRARRRAAVGMVAVCAAVAPVAQAAAPTNDEQYALELINRMRIDPLRELQRMVNIIPPTATSPATWGTPFSNDPDVDAAIDYFLVDADFLWNEWQLLEPAPALAWNSNLNDAASYHNSRMIFHDAQEHEFAGEPGLVERIEDRGYVDWETLGENIFAYAEGVEHAHAGFAVDWGLLDAFGQPIPPGIQDPPGHRLNMMDPAFRDIGIAITPESDSMTEVGPLLMTQDFGAEFDKVYVTGVHYGDIVKHDNFYTPGEGNGGITVTAFLPGTTTVVKSTTTSASGGYALELPPGVYDIAFGGNGIVYRNVLVGIDNVKIDSRTTWIRNADGSWHDPANWFAGVPDGVGATASLYDVATARRTLNTTLPVTVGILNFENPAGYRIAGPGTITFNRSLGDAEINVIGAGSHEIAAPVTVQRDTLITVAPGAELLLSGPLSMNSRGTFKRGPGTLTISGPQLHGAIAQFFATAGTTNINSDAGTAVAAPLHLDATGAGTVVNLNSTQHLRQLTIGGARVNVTPGANKVLAIRQQDNEPVAVFAGGQLDLHDNDMVVHSTAAQRQAVLTRVIDHVKSARNAPTPWTGPGIGSSAAAQNPLTGLAAMLNPGLAIFSGEMVDANAILIKYTYNGDANLDGRINADDYFKIDSGFLAQPANPTYADGDFNYDARINADDYFLIDSSFLGQGAVLGIAANSIAAVPEPGASLAAMAAVGLLARRRRCR